MYLVKQIIFRIRVCEVQVNLIKINSTTKYKYTVNIYPLDILNYLFDLLKVVCSNADKNLLFTEKLISNYDKTIL